MHHSELFRLRRRYPPPAPDKQACRSSGGVCEVDSTRKLVEPPLPKLRKDDATARIIFTERYRSGGVCERCRWQRKRAIRSGCGRTKSSTYGCDDFFGHRNRNITGRSRVSPKIEYCLLSYPSFNIYAGLSKWGRLRALPAAEKASNKEWLRSNKIEHLRMR